MTNTANTFCRLRPKQQASGGRLCPPQPFFVRELWNTESQKWTAGIPHTDIDTSLSFQNFQAKALVCWILIAVDAGSTNTLAGARMLKHEPKCNKTNAITKTHTKTMTSILCGLMLWSMATIVSMLTATKPWVGLFSIIQHHESQSISTLPSNQSTNSAWGKEAWLDCDPTQHKLCNTNKLVETQPLVRARYEWLLGIQFSTSRVCVWKTIRRIDV